MIYNEDFVWLHFPKCAGTKIEHLFQQYFYADKSIVQDAVGVQHDPTVAWHDSISQRSSRNPSFQLGKRTVICSFRKLPSWLQSRYNFEVNRSRNLKHDPDMLLQGEFLEAGGYQNHADNYVKGYLPPELLTENKVEFIRTEHFEEDFINVFGKFIDVSKVPTQEFESRVNESQQFLPDRIVNKLLNDNKKVYEKCPYWSKVEQMAYAS